MLRIEQLHRPPTFFIGLIHPVVAAIYVLAIQFRLARFNAAPEEKSSFCQGISSPDAAYVCLLVGMIPGVGDDVGFLVAAALAVLPLRLGPKGLRIPRAALGAATVALFVHGGR